MEITFHIFLEFAQGLERNNRHARTLILNKPVMLANASQIMNCLVCFVIASTFFLMGGDLLAEEFATVPDARQQRPESVSKVAVIEFEGEITYENGSYFRNRFRAAKAAGCDVLLIDVDSPGGLKTESLDIATLIRDCDWAYTVVFVKD